MSDFSYNDELIRRVARRFPAEDRQLLIKVLEGEQDFDYTLKSGSWIVTDSGRTAETYTTTAICNAKNKSMCVIGALVAAKLPPTALLRDVAYGASHYAEVTELTPGELDLIIDLKLIPEFIEELRTLEVE